MELGISKHTVSLRPYDPRVWCVTQAFQKLACPIPLNGSAGVSRHRKVSLFGRYFQFSSMLRVTFLKTPMSDELRYALRGHMVVMI